MEKTLKNSLNAYSENPKLFPKTRISKIEKINVNNTFYDGALIYQEYLSEAKNGTLKEYLKDNWNSEALDVCLNKLEELVKKHETNVKYKKIETEEEFLKHDEYYNKRWNLPTFEYFLNKLECKNEYIDYLKTLDLSDIEKKYETNRYKISKITREFSPRNILVDGEKLTFDTELYGHGSVFLEYGGMLSQLLEAKKEYAINFLEHIEKRYDFHAGKTSMVEVIGYRLNEIYKCKNNKGDGRKKYHIEQLKKLVDIYKEKYDD